VQCDLLNGQASIRLPGALVRWLGVEEKTVASPTHRDSPEPAQHVGAEQAAWFHQRFGLKRMVTRVFADNCTSQTRQPFTRTCPASAVTATPITSTALPVLGRLIGYADESP
jgi:hypothetical protein